MHLNILENTQIYEPSFDTTEYRKNFEKYIKEYEEFEPLKKDYLPLNISGTGENQSYKSHEKK
jgi:hypothetical protein